MAQLSRREVLGQFAAGGAALTILPSMARAATPLTTAFNWVSNIEYVGYYLGIENGHFAQNGLDASFLAGGPNTPPAMVSLAAGRADLAYANWTQFSQAKAKGNDLVIIGAQYPVNPAGFLSLTEFSGMQDLVGKRILLPTASDARHVDALFRLNGLEPDYTAVPAGFSPEPLLAGDGDVYLCFVVNQPITLERMGMKNGEDFHVALLEELGYKIPNHFLVTSRESLEAERSKYVGFLKGFTAGWQDNINDPASGLAVTLSNYGAALGLDADQQTRQNELQIPLLYGAGTDKLFWFDKEIFKEVAARVAETDDEGHLPDIDSSVDLSLLADAQA